MLNRKLLLASAAAVTLFAAPQAQALTFDLVDYNGSVAGTQAELGFQMAAAYWESVISSNVTVRLEIGYNPLGTGIIGSTGSSRAAVGVSSVYQQLAATGNSGLDGVAVANLSALTANGGLQMITSGYDTDATKLGIDVNKVVWDNDDTANNMTLGANTAVLKALGYSISGGTGVDARVTFSSNFSFDFDPTDGIQSGQMDFIGVAIHEIGHALGFTSGVDIYDNPTNVNAFNVNANGSGALFTTLDLFRYSADVRGVAPGTGPVLDLSVARPDTIALGGNPYFSIDGGQTQFLGNSLFSTGRNYGDGQQASHFKDLGGCTGQIGIMDPNFCYAQMGEVTASDLGAFDAMGWNLNLDVLANSGYKVTSSDIYSQYFAAVPEPGTWAMMIAGFGIIGASMRRRSGKLAIA